MNFERARKLMKRGYKVALPNNADSFYFMKPMSSFVFRYDNKDKKTYVFVQYNLLSKDGFELYGILDDAEKGWLKEVVRPFKKRIILVTKHARLGKEFISLEVFNEGKCEDVMFPYFPAGKMYKGMKLDHHYNADDLGLTK